MRITGSGFQAGATLTLDGQRLPVAVESSVVIQFTSPAHSSGVVDVVLTNPDGRTVAVAGGYTSAPPQSFDFNGTWAGSALAHPDGDAKFRALHSDMDLRFTVQRQLLSSLACGGDTLTFSPPLPVHDGEFVVSGPNGSTITGRIVSAAAALGTINTPACPATRWTATKQ